MKDRRVSNWCRRGREIHIPNLRVGNRRQGRSGTDFSRVRAFATGVGCRNDIVISPSVNDGGVGISRGGCADNVCVRSTAGSRAFYVVIGCAGNRCPGQTDLPVVRGDGQDDWCGRRRRRRRLETGSRNMADDVVIIFRHINSAVGCQGHAIRLAG